MSKLNTTSKWRILFAVLLSAMCLTSTQSHAFAQGNGLISRWMAENDYVDSISGLNGTPYGNTGFQPGKIGSAFYFNGFEGRVFIPDAPALALTHSMCLSAWISVFSNLNLGRIIMRGDDRPGLTPYALSIDKRGHIVFEITNEKNISVSVRSPKTVSDYSDAFLHVAATLDDATGNMRLFVGGNQVAHTTTKIRPFATLDSNYSPGIAIGNSQSDSTVEIFHGLIDDLKVYNVSSPKVTLVDLQLDQVKVKGGTTVKAVFMLDDSSILPVVARPSSTTGVAKVPSSVTMHSGLYEGHFTINTSKVTKSTSGYISVSVNAIKRRVKLTITP